MAHTIDANVPRLHFVAPNDKVRPAGSLHSCHMITSPGVSGLEQTTTVVPATLAVMLRFTARYVSRAGFWWDDYTILVDLVSDPRTPNASEWKMADS